MLQKISSTDAAALLKQAGTAISTLVTERDELRVKIAQQDRDVRVVRIAQDMEEKGLSPDLSFEEKVAAVNSAKNLAVTEEAIKLAAPQGRGFGGLGGDDALASSTGASALEHYLTTGEDPTEL